VNQAQQAGVAAPVGQQMQGVLDAIARLQAACASDAAELRRIDEQRQRDVAAAAKAARDQVDREQATDPELIQPTSPGGQLRAEVAAFPYVQVRHFDPGAPPDSFTAAISEWRSLSASARGGVARFRSQATRWSERMIKRAVSAPQVPDELWRDLDRLDLLHRHLPALSQAVIADRIRETTGAADVVMAAEAERQRAGQQHLANEVSAAVAAISSLAGLGGVPWTDARWQSPAAAHVVEPLIRLGTLQLDLPRHVRMDTVPVLTAFPLETGIAVGAAVPSRNRAIGLLRALVLRLFAAVPPGGLHVKAVDPVSLGQSVAEFRHLAEYDSQLMDEKTWTSERDIERLVDDLSEHLEVVISRYLRGQFTSIDEYNQQAGELAQPYRVLVVFDYPSGFSERASRQLLSLVENGPRCGVYTLLHYDNSTEAGDGHREVPLSRLVHSMRQVIFTRDGARLESPGAGRVSLGFVPDDAPRVTFGKDGQPETGFARLLAEVGTEVRRSQASPPAVTLDTLLPVLQRSRAGMMPHFRRDATAFSTDPATWWQALTTDNAVAPIGRSGAREVTSVYFSSTEVAGGAIMVGIPRSGKTTALHSMITTMSMLYSPDELELYLIDAKHGVEFKVYENLPHARMVSVRSEREFSLAVLQSLAAEIRRRAELMKADGAGRANLTEYRQATGALLSRIVVVIDEFHEIFEEPDRIGQEAFAAFSDIVRMGPFSGVHIVVASQTLSSMPAMDRPTLLLLPQRVAFMCNEYDAEIVMGDTNRATRLLSKTGEGLFNPARGDESRNQLFRGLYIPAEERTALIGELARKAAGAGWTRRPRVFDGDALVVRPAAVAPIAPASPVAPAVSGGASTRLTIGVGEPFTLADEESVVLRRTRGANVLLLGDSDDETTRDPAVRGVLHSCLLAARSQGAEVTVLDFMGDEDAGGGPSVLDVAAAVGAGYVRSRGAETALAGLAATAEERAAAADYRAPGRLLVLAGLERALSLSPVDPYAYEAQTGASPAAHLAAILRGGPEVGIHVVVSTDRARTVERRLGADLLPEFTLRIAGSGADQQDLASISGQYGDVQALRPGQLLVADLLRGTAKRIRGYEVLTNSTITAALGG
jgi:DNA segregation ATPase FtsK/SpoIIIE, S-DNA-T family